MLGPSRPEPPPLTTPGSPLPLRDESPLPRRDVRYRDQLGRGVWRCGAAYRIPAASRLASWQWPAALPSWPSAARGVRSLAPAARSGKERDGSRSSLPASGKYAKAYYATHRDTILTQQRARRAARRLELEQEQRTRPEPCQPTGATRRGDLATPDPAAEAEGCLAGLPWALAAISAGAGVSEQPTPRRTAP